MWYLLLLLIAGQCSAYEVVYAVNCGGEREFVDSRGIIYEEDPLREGLTSNYGSRYAIDRVPPEDAPLYQTERYSKTSFSYTIPLIGEGKYLLVLKFCEVFFQSPNMKVFDVLLNDIHPVISELDIFGHVGLATAHDEYIPFSISRNKLFVRDRVSEIRGGRLKITFLKGQLDNPKINAILLLKGVDVHDFQRLPPITKAAVHKKPATSQFNNEPTAATAIEDDFDPIDVTRPSLSHQAAEEDRKVRRTSGPKQPDPYDMDSSLITILCILVATIVPLVILRCRL